MNKKTRILLVDDEQETLDLIAEYLTEKGFDLSTSTTAEHAIQLAEQDGYQIAIVDLHLPGMTGSELLKHIKKVRPHIQVIMITGYGTIRDAVECMKLGASDFITKPILLDHLHLTINRILQESRLKEEAELAVYYKNLSRTDELTGLYNFRHLVSLLKSEVTRHLRYNRTMSLAMIDIDDFKSYNDSRGHEEGNELLMRLSHVFRHNTRNCDVLARYGGEEFVIIFPETALEEAVIVAERICRTVSVTLEVSVTIGLAGLPRHTADYNELIRMADRAMYWGKQHGKNQIVVYDDSMSTCK
ncbi:MAG TPA: diguanylate cyclase [Deltaproteobacteria bacterium]|nr:diguanylate cyclase [Deltaproteobacteria bacterium]MDI9541616.1 diguanylate cyclase [Pseudomonadota bacterium]NLW68741.1 diguanylate cyclase [Bacteriovoracaceae bacterium]HRR20124.1 diguanylate cyclase [Desulfomonilia bacterium]HOD72502.1 diguanylate cyclase [Deltaproteobacteria bacterium]